MNLHQRHQDLLAERPHVRARDAAAILGVTEAELVAARPDTVRLRHAWRDLLGALAEIGPVMVLTRNEAAVHEKTGVYAPVRLESPHVGGVYGPDIDLRLFPTHWAHAFASTVDTRHGPRRALQIFDGAGVAVHKIYATPDSDLAVWDAIVERFQDDARPVEPVPAPPRADPGPFDRDALLAGWAALEDTHDFFVLLRRLSVDRRSALIAAEGRFTERVPVTAVASLLEDVAHTGTPIMVFAGNRGCIQIHSGPVQRIKAIDAWLNVLDPGFNLHLRTELFHAAWIVRKPTVDGDVTSLEVLDAQGDVIVQFFGTRKPGRPEDPQWREALGRLPREG